MKSPPTLICLFFIGALSSNQVARAADPPVKNEKAWSPSAASDWLDVSLEATAREHERNTPRPTIGSRMLMLAVTAMYDAWAAYDAKAVGTRLGGSFRRPVAERTDAHRITAIGYATTRVLLYLFPEDAAWITAEAKKRNVDPANQTRDPATPEGVGNLVATALIESRRHDGANQHGDEVGSPKASYADWTYYRHVNPSNKIIDPDCWQPIEFDDGKGGKVTPGFLTPHWYRVKPFALERSDQFRPGPPPLVGSPQLKKEIDEVLHFNATLTTEQKAIVEFMRDGPKSTGQSGHWLRFSQQVSRRDRNDLERDVKLFFVVGNTAFDAFIAAWDSKRYYDSSRPWTLIRHYYKGKTVRGWAGIGKGVVTLPAEDWHPYSPLTFITPPFPGYVSGHSAVSGACSKMLELFTGSDTFAVIEKRKAGELTEPGVKCEFMQMVDGKPLLDPHLTCDVALQLPTFSAAAEMAGISRVMGGYHIQSDNVAGLKLGRDVAGCVWGKAKQYFDGTAK
ncbi:MAG: vanadium-dependent haloperoxidase [Gemmataceae bacterium]